MLELLLVTLVLLDQLVLLDRELLDLLVRKVKKVQLVRQADRQVQPAQPELQA
jgi:hypothetical protein